MMKYKLLSIGILFAFGFGLIQAQRSAELQKLYEMTDQVSSNKVAIKTPPLIGISAARNNKGYSLLSEMYANAIIKAGGMPIIIPTTTDAKTLLNIVSTLDGLVFSGGADITPAYYNEAVWNKTVEVDSIRDVYELTLIKLAANRNVPILGICRGEQLINVAFGGTLYQDLPSQKKSDIKHSQNEPRELATQPISIIKGTGLCSILGNNETLSVNSFHHQAIKDMASGFIPTAIAPDGVTEGLENPNRNISGIQWHPEGLVAGGDSIMLGIFSAIVQKADIYRKAKEMHKRFLSVDTHCDTPLLFGGKDFNIARRDSAFVDLPKMTEGCLDGIFMAAYIRQGARDDVSSLQAVEKVTGLIQSIYEQAEKNKDLCGIATTANDLARLKGEGKKAIFIGIENGYGIGKDIKNLARYKDMGVGYMTLCHTKDNDICDSSSDARATWKGLSPFGKDVVKEMNRIGMVIDISHVHESTFWDAINLSSQPIVATHSSARALCDHDRNLTDKQLKAIAKNNGVVQVCPVDIFINSKNKNEASINDFLDHIDHVVKVAGIDHVGIGSDFDGGGRLIGLEGANDMINITTGLIERGYSEEDIAKIWGGNFLRVLTQVQAAAKK